MQQLCVNVESVHWKNCAICIDGSRAEQYIQHDVVIAAALQQVLLGYSKFCSNLGM